MKITTINGIEFESYPLDTTKFRDVPGVYVISTAQKWIDVGETDKLGTRLANHERIPCWRQNSNLFTLWVNFRRIDSQQERLDLEAELRQKLNPTCGNK
jgi:hypothetical protein